MNLSTRITGLTGGGSDGWDVFYRARRLKSEGHPITELTIGEAAFAIPDDELDRLYRRLLAAG